MLDALNRAEVRYVVVGGLAVVMHGHVRMTQDIDLVLALDKDNLERAIDALEGAGLRPRAPVEAKGFVDEETRRSWTEDKGLVVFSLINPSNPLVAVDLFAKSPFDWDSLWDHSEVMVIEGVAVRVCSKEHLIAMKRATARPVDLADVEALEQ